MGKIANFDKYKMYNIHKVTLICFTIEKAIHDFKTIFEDEIELQEVPDKVLAARGIKWLRFNDGERAEIHLIPAPASLKREFQFISRQENIVNPMDEIYGFADTHVGIYVPNLTEIINRVIKTNYMKYTLKQRADGMYQFYINIRGCLEYLELDSINYDPKKTGIYPSVFEPKEKTSKKSKKAKKSKKSKTKKHKKITNKEQQGIYRDPIHPQGIRVIKIKNDKIYITGNDKPGDLPWKISSNIKKNGETTLDFSIKGGPNNVEAKLKNHQLILKDGNTWSRIATRE